LLCDWSQTLKAILEMAFGRRSPGRNNFLIQYRSDSPPLGATA
jgi:hypothetical protein